MGQSKTEYQQRLVVKNRIMNTLKSNPQKKHFHFRRIMDEIDSAGNKQQVIKALMELEGEGKITVVRRSQRNYYGLKGSGT